MRLFPDIATCGYVVAQLDVLNLRPEERMSTPREKGERGK
jgi:hypothetical protein